MVTKHEEPVGKATREAADRLTAVLTDMQHAAANNAPVTTAMINELTAVRDSLKT